MNSKQAFLSLLAMSLCCPVGADLIIGPGETVCEGVDVEGYYDFPVEVKKDGTW